jgi:hypothetical protein
VIEITDIEEQVMTTLKDFLKDWYRSEKDNDSLMKFYEGRYSGALTIAMLVLEINADEIYRIDLEAREEVNSEVTFDE